MFQHFSSFKVVTHDLHHTRLNNADFREIVTTMESIFAKSFITRVWSHKSIKEHLSDCPQIQIGYIDAEPIFYCSILLRTFHKNRDYLWINSMAIDKLYQNQE